MVAVETDPRSFSVTDVRPDGNESNRACTEKRSGISEALLVVAAGIFLVTLAYANARGGWGYATPLFWTGQVLILGYVAFRVLDPSTSHRESEFLVCLYAGAQSMIRWAYSPHMFTYSDELQHLRSLLNVLTTHHLFHKNFNIPISPRYPGMENDAAELAQVSSISPFVAGVIIVSVSHVLLAACLLLLFRVISQSSWVASIGVIAYMLLNFNSQYFDTSFHYEAVALPFLVLSILFSVRFAIRHYGRYQSFAGLLGCAAIVAMTHNLSALALVALLAVMALATRWFQDTRNLAPSLWLCAASAAVVVGCWIVFVAPGTGEYLSSAARDVLDGLTRLGRVEGKAPMPHGPLFDRVVSLGSILLTLGLLALSVRRSRSRRPLERSLVYAVAAIYPSVIAVRLLVANGAELSSRSFSYVSLFTAVAVAGVLHPFASAAHRRRRSSPRISGGLIGVTAVTVVLLAGSVTIGTPEWWQRLPGTFQIDGFASGVDRVGTSRAEWAAANLQPGLRYFGDRTSVELLSALAQLDPIRQHGSLYYSDHLTPEDSALINTLSATYLDVDMRMADYPTPAGHYFETNDDDGGQPIADAALTKFDNTAGMSRIYDSGYDHFYDLRGVKGTI